MSYGYLIITFAPCPVLTQTRGASFTPVVQSQGAYAYFRLCETGLYTVRQSDDTSIVNDAGLLLFKHLHDSGHHPFVFADVLLHHRESEEDFADGIIRLLRQNAFPSLRAQADLPLQLRQAYHIKR